MVDLSYEVVWEGLWCPIVGDPGMGCRTKGARLGIPGLIDFLGEEHPVLAQGDHIHLSTRVNIHGNQLCAILCGELQLSIE